MDGRFLDATRELEGGKLVVGEDGAPESVAPAVGETAQVVRVLYAEERGQLTFVCSDSSTVTVSGFPTLAQLGAGPRGKKGKAGKPGRDGFPGRDGPTGQPGCEGPKGGTGPVGERGNDGEDGPTGQTGMMGRRGITGPTGIEGPTGKTGPDGVVGNPGPNCMAGPTGPTGPTPAPYAVFDTKLPANTGVFVWAIPATPGKPRPEVPRWTPVLINIPYRAVSARRQFSTKYFAANTDVVAKVSGGSGVYEYEWVLPKVDGVTFTQNGTRLSIAYVYRVPDSKYKGERFKIKLNVRDSGRPGRPVFQGTAEVFIEVVQ